MHFNQLGDSRPRAGRTAPVLCLLASAVSSCLRKVGPSGIGSSVGAWASADEYGQRPGVLAPPLSFQGPLPRAQSWGMTGWQWDWGVSWPTASGFQHSQSQLSCQTRQTAWPGNWPLALWSGAGAEHHCPTGTATRGLCPPRDVVPDRGCASLIFEPLPLPSFTRRGQFSPLSSEGPGGVGGSGGLPETVSRREEDGGGRQGGGQGQPRASPSSPQSSGAFFYLIFQNLCRKSTTERQ